MISVDARFDVAAAIARLEHEHGIRVRAMQSRYDELCAALRDAASARGALNGRLTLEQAEAVVVQDFDIPDGYPALHRIGLETQPYPRSAVELSEPLPPGRYRAVILISERK